ncbi:MAG TPA: hypothetical protein VNT52_00930 [Acidimicrobiales bacterium]|nr:hypothetical protein [Acidimicrobiales bacterium]
MSDLDITDVLTDPDFVVGLVRKRVTVTLVNGRSQRAEASTPFEGVVVPDRGAALDRLPDVSRVSGSQWVFAPFDLSLGDEGRDADIVTYNGADYTVRGVLDYSRFSPGFVAALIEPNRAAG